MVLLTCLWGILFQYASGRFVSHLLGLLEETYCFFFLSGFEQTDAQNAVCVGKVRSCLYGFPCGADCFFRLTDAIVHDSPFCVVQGLSGLHAYSPVYVVDSLLEHPALHFRLFAPVIEQVVHFIPHQ